MADRRGTQFGLLAGAASLAAMAGGASADAAFSEADGKAAIETWLGALYSHDPAKVEKAMAPDFQLLRSDGTSYDRVTYLTSLPTFQKKASIGSLKVTGQGDTLVATYLLTSKMMVKNKPVAEKAPRISVFRKTGGTWQMVAHANFAKIG